MFKKWLKPLKIIFIIVILPIVIFSYSMYTMPAGGELLYTSSSPSGRYVIEVYHHPHSLSPNGVRCRVRPTYGVIGRNIYWCFPNDNVHIKWKSETEVNIDGVVLDIRWGRYDCRRD